MLLKIPENPIKDFDECLRGIREMFGQTPAIDSTANVKIKQILNYYRTRDSSSLYLTKQ